jgi:hypothetical protein
MYTYVDPLYIPAVAGLLAVSWQDLRAGGTRRTSYRTTAPPAGSAPAPPRNVIQHRKKDDNTQHITSLENILKMHPIIEA